LFKSKVLPRILPMKNLAEGWTQFSGFIFSKKPTQTRFEESRKAYHAGALAAFRFMLDAAGDVDKLKPIFEEAESVCKDITAPNRSGQ
jgi:hypothetical protein